LVDSWCSPFIHVGFRHARLDRILGLLPWFGGFAAQARLRSAKDTVAAKKKD